MLESVQRLAAVTNREIMDISRRRTPFVVRTIFAAILGTMAFSVLITASSNGVINSRSVSMGMYYLFGSLVHVGSALLLGIGGLLGIASAHAEKRNRTLGLLALSRLHPGEVAAGKTIALSGLAMMVLISALPLFGMLGWLGGLDYAWLARSGWLALVIALFGVGLGLMVGFAFRNVGLAAVATLLLGAVWLWLPYFFLRGTHPAMEEFLLSVWIGASVQSVASQGVAPYGYAEPLWVTLLLALLFVVTAAWAIRRAAAPAAGHGLRRSFELADRLFERINLGNIRFSQRGRRQFRGNPVTWLARTASGYGIARYSTRIAMVNLAASLVIGSAMVAEVSWSYLGPMIVMPLFFLLPLTSAASAIAGERSRGTLSVLLATPLTSRRLLAGKARAALQLFGLAVVPPTAVLLLCAVLLQTAGSSDFLLLMLILMFFAECICCFMLTLGASVFCRGPLRAGFAGFGLFVAVNGLPPFLALITWEAWGSGQSWAVVTFVTIVGAFCLSGLFYATRLRGKPGWDYALFIFVIIAAAGVLAGLPIGGRNRTPFMALAEIGEMVVGKQAGALSVLVAFLLATALLVYAFSNRSFNHAVGRAQ